MSICRRRRRRSIWRRVRRSVRGSGLNLTPTSQVAVAAQRNAPGWLRWQHSHVLTDNVPGSGGGGYGDSYVQDEFFWAAAELYVTTGEEQYLNFLLHSPFYSRFQGSSGGTAMSWASTAALGTITLAIEPDVPENLQSRMQQQIIDFADQLLIVQNGEGYRIPFGPRCLRLGVQW